MEDQTTNRLPVFSIITPSFNMLPYLRLCSRSISDQNVIHEHIVVDAASTDGTVEWIKQQAGIRSIVEKDEGMYDAINKGIRQSRGEIISYLNCDEQYLPGTLQRVREYFRTHPEVDLLFGNALIIRPDGQLLAYRKSFAPRWQYIWASFLYLYTCSMFVRRRVFDSGVLFEKEWKVVGDAVFVINALRSGFRARYVSEYFSAFVITGGNLSSGETANAELKAFHDQAPWWLRKSHFITHPLIRLEKLFNGGYREKFPFSYSVYVAGRPDARREFSVDQASPLWKRWKIE